MPQSLDHPVHDCVVRGVSADWKQGTFILHAIDHTESIGFDIVFEGVQQWSLENVLARNILFDIEDAGQPKSLPAELVPTSTQREFIICSSYGLTGRVIGASWTTRTRLAT